MRRVALLLPVFFLSARVQEPLAARPFEIQAGLFVLNGNFDSASLVSIETMGITHVIDLRKPIETDLTKEPDRMRLLHGAYWNCPTDREPSVLELDAFRSRFKSLPPGAKVLVHCASGNRAAGALLAYWVLDGRRSIEESLALAHRAGLHNPATEAAVLAYVKSRTQHPEPGGPND